MKSAFFQAVCPVEVGDVVAVKAKRNKDTNMKEAVYMQQGCPVMIAGTVELHRITDIVTLHYFVSGDIQFMYELDGCGKYEPLDITLQIKELDEELKRRGR